MALIFSGSDKFGGEYSDTAQERRAGTVRADSALPERQLWLRDRQPVDAGSGHGGRHHLSLDAADAGRWLGEHLFGGSARRAAAQILPDDRGRTQNAHGAAGGMEKLHRVG